MLGHSAECLVGYYTLTRLHLKIVVLPQSEAFSTYFAGRHSIPDLRDTKLTEGERLVRDLDVARTSHSRTSSVAEALDSPKMRPQNSSV